jgi:hypothetical protein
MLTGLHFANGVALAADESFVAVAETGAYRLTRLWLSSPDPGRSDMLVDNLPGFPDNPGSQRSPGISNDPATWRRQAPLMRDVAAALAEQGSEAAETLAARLTPWTTGSFREMFDGPTTTVPQGQMVA